MHVTIQLIAGIIASFGCLIAAALLKKYQQPWVNWFFTSIIALCLTLYVHLNSVAHSENTAQYFLTAGMVLFALVGLYHFWDMMTYTQ